MSVANGSTRRAFFMDTPGGRRFALATIPTGRVQGAVFHLHAFCEEMNKSRRMVTLCAQTLAADGWLVLQMDFLGCGDSAGDFGDAAWQDWIDDVSAGWSWLDSQACDGPVVLWTLRAGSLIAADWIAQSGQRPPLILWQPVLSGKQHLTQFLRLKAAADLQGATETRAVMDQVRSDLDAGKGVEVAGYMVSPDLAAGMGSSTLRLPHGYAGPVNLLEVIAAERTDPSPGLVSLSNSWLEAGCAAGVKAFPGAAFWQTQEIETVPALIEASRHALSGLLA